MPSPLVSIIIPAYNTERFIQESIESALQQTWPNKEIIVVDDQSSDQTPEIAKEYGDQIHLIEQKKSGACRARNQGLKHAKGKYIQFLDADDKLDLQKIEKQIPLLENGADMVLSKIMLFGDDREPRLEKRLHPIPEGDPLLYFLNYPIQTAAPLHRCDHLERVGGFRDQLIRAQEVDLHLRLAFHRPKVIMIDLPLVWVRMHDGSRISRRQYPQDYMLNLFIQLADEFTATGILDVVRKKTIAGKIMQQSIYAFRNGTRESARKGFEKAYKLDPSPSFFERNWVKKLYRFIGPYQAEHVLNIIRKLGVRKLASAFKVPCFKNSRSKAEASFRTPK